MGNSESSQVFHKTIPATNNDPAMSWGLVTPVPWEISWRQRNHQPPPTFFIVFRSKNKNISWICLAITYIGHWPLSLFYSKSLGNFYVNFLPIRKRSGKFLCKKKPPRKRSGKFLCKKKPPRKRSGKCLCKRTLYVDLDFIEANTYLYVRDLDCFM